MPRTRESPAKLLEWSPRALRAYLATLSFIAEQDPFAAGAVRDRVERALASLVEFPSIGTPGAKRGERRFPIPNTGHVLNYRVLRDAIRIQSWYRARLAAPDTGAS